VGGRVGEGGESSKNLDLPLQRKMGELFEQMRRISFFHGLFVFLRNNNRKESKLSCSDKESMPKTKPHAHT
jgi:hypothetical protein